MKAMKQIESLKDRALLELTDELKRADEKLRTVEQHLESKNIEIKQLSNEKKEALAAGQFAAEATLLIVHATQEDEEFSPIEAVIAPVQSEIKKYKNEVSRLQEDKKALQGITKSKEAALIEAEIFLHSALERLLIVENVQNQNLELQRQVEICQDESKCLNKIHCQKVVEVEKFTQTIHELKESALVHGATTNAIRDYQRRISELNMPVSTTLEPVMSDPCKMPVSTTLEPVMSNPCEVLDSLLSSSDSVTTDSCQSDEVITDFEVQTILHNDDSDGLVYYLSFSEFKFSNTEILDWALNRKAYKCISVLLCLKVDLSNTLNAAEELPLTVVAESLNPRLVEAFIRHGAKTSTLRTSGYKTFVLKEALDSFCWNLEDQWNPEQSIFKLIIILCLPRMKHSLETIRLLVQSTKEASDIIYSSAMGGELMVLAILLMVAREKVMEYKIPVLGYDGSGIDGETKKHLDSETIRSVVVKNKLHKMICQDRQQVEMFRMYKQVKKSAISLFLVFEKAGDAIERYLKLQQPNVPEEQVIKEVALLLVDAGFNVKPEHTDLSEIYRCVIVETDKLLEKESGQQFRMERGRYEYSQMHIKFGVTSYGWKRWVFLKRNPHGYPDLSSVPLPFFLNCKVMVPTASGLRRMMDMAVTIMDKQQLLPDFLPLKELVPVAPLIKKGLRILRRWY